MSCTRFRLHIARCWLLEHLLVQGMSKLEGQLSSNGQENLPCVAEGLEELETTLASILLRIQHIQSTVSARK